MRPLLSSGERVNILSDVYNATIPFKSVEKYDKESDDIGEILRLTEMINMVEEVSALVMKQSLGPDVLDEIFALLLPWLSTAEEKPRFSAVLILKTVLSTYEENMCFTIGVSF